MMDKAQHSLQAVQTTKVHKLPLFDIGANLIHRALYPHIDYLVACARNHSIHDISITAAHPDNTEQAIALIHARRTITDTQSGDCDVRLTTTCGLHPHLAEQFSDKLYAKIAQLTDMPQVAVIGETGLDYFRMIAPKAKQRESFCAHLELAAKTGKPVFLHQREAHADFIAILREFRSQLHKVVVHCFTDSGDALIAYLQLNCSIGITGWVCDSKRGTCLRDIVYLIPDNRLMVETDSPYLMPPEAKALSKQSSIPRHNLPHFLPFVIDTLAKCRNQSFAHIAKHTYRNSCRFFYCEALS